MEDVTRYLDAVHYPATKQELVEAAIAADAPQEAVERLQALTREQYDEPGEVERALAELSGA
jgi:Protein of unknown function (DUF2795)